MQHHPSARACGAAGELAAKAVRVTDGEQSDAHRLRSRKRGVIPNRLSRRKITHRDDVRPPDADWRQQRRQVRAVAFKRQGVAVECEARASEEASVNGSGLCREPGQQPCFVKRGCISGVQPGGAFPCGSDLFDSLRKTMLLAMRDRGAGNLGRRKVSHHTIKLQLRVRTKAL